MDDHKELRIMPDWREVREVQLTTDGNTAGHVGMVIMPAREMPVPRKETNPPAILNPAILEGFCPYGHGALKVGYLHTQCPDPFSEDPCLGPACKRGHMCPFDCTDHGDHGKLVGSCEQCGCSWRFDAEEQQIYGVACVPGRHHCGMPYYVWGGPE